MFRLMLECPHSDCHRTEVVLLETTIEGDTTIFQMLCAGTYHHFYVAVRPNHERKPSSDGHYYSRDRAMLIVVGVTKDDVIAHPA